MDVSELNFLYFTVRPFRASDLKIEVFNVDTILRIIHDEVETVRFKHMGNEYVQYSGPVKVFVFKPEKREIEDLIKLKKDEYGTKFVPDKYDGPIVEISFPYPGIVEERIRRGIKYAREQMVTLLFSPNVDLKHVDAIAAAAGIFPELYATFRYNVTLLEEHFTSYVETFKRYLNPRRITYNSDIGDEKTFSEFRYGILYETYLRLNRIDGEFIIPTKEFVYEAFGYTPLYGYNHDIVILWHAIGATRSIRMAFSINKAVDPSDIISKIYLEYANYRNLLSILKSISREIFSD